jgi:hypothetical protein
MNKNKFEWKQYSAEVKVKKNTVEDWEEFGRELQYEKILHKNSKLYKKLNDLLYSSFMKDMFITKGVIKL